VSAGFTFPESHYSVEKTFFKQQSPQSEAFSFVADDIEDSDDLATDTHFFQNEFVFRITPSSDTSSEGMSRQIDRKYSELVYLLHRQLLI